MNSNLVIGNATVPPISRRHNEAKKTSATLDVVDNMLSAFWMERVVSVDVYKSFGASKSGQSCVSGKLMANCRLC